MIWKLPYLLTYWKVLVAFLPDVPMDHNDCWPLSAEHMSNVNDNRLKLVELLDTEYDLLSAMRATTCLSHQQINYLRTLSDTRERNSQMLEMLKRRSISQFNEFIDCLEKYQRHLVPFLTGDEGN